nr:putative integron gene cassette protein [uncultured bacterium]
MNSGVRPVKKFVVPQTPEEILSQLQELLPSFSHSWEGEDEWPGLGRSFHSVARDLAHFFPQHCSSLTDKQLRAFADWINGIVAASGNLENAISHASSSIRLNSASTDCSHRI